MLVNRVYNTRISLVTVHFLNKSTILHVNKRNSSFFKLRKFSEHAATGSGPESSSTYSGNSLIPGERFRTGDYEEISKVQEYKKAPGKKKSGPKYKPKQIKLAPRNYKLHKEAYKDLVFKWFLQAYPESLSRREISGRLRAHPRKVRDLILKPLFIEGKILKWGQKTPPFERYMPNIKAPEYYEVTGEKMPILPDVDENELMRLSPKIIDEVPLTEYDHTGAKDFPSDPNEKAVESARWIENKQLIDDESKELEEISKIEGWDDLYDDKEDDENKDEDEDVEKTFSAIDDDESYDEDDLDEEEEEEEDNDDDEDLEEINLSDISDTDEDKLDEEDSNENEEGVFDKDLQTSFKNGQKDKFVTTAYAKSRQFRPLFSDEEDMNEDQEKIKHRWSQDFDIQENETSNDDDIKDDNNLNLDTDDKDENFPIDKK